jgi:tetratricopeptide (TPR) repeat protein
MLKWSPSRGPDVLPYAHRAVELDPNSAIILGNLADTYLRLGDLENAARYFEQTIAAHPDFVRGYAGYSNVLSDRGDKVGAIEAHRKAAELDPDSVGEAAELAFLYIIIGAFAEAEAVYRSMQERFAGHEITGAIGLAIALAKGEEPDTRAVIAAGLEKDISSSGALYLGYTALLGGEFELALDAFERAPGDLLATRKITPEFLDLWTGTLCELSWVLLETEGNEGFGRELLDKSIERYESGFHEDVRHTERFNWNLCYLLAGDTEKALDVLELELDNNATDLWPLLLRTPLYDAVRKDPRFVAMTSEFERRRAAQKDALRRKDKAKPGFEF